MSERPKDLLDAAYRWPRTGERLLRDSEDWRRSVGFPPDESSRHVHLWSGYLRAGAALIDLCEREPHERHALIFPILFNYRHGIELAMKWIIAQYGGYASVEIGKIDYHDLWRLWSLCKRVIAEVGSEDEALPAVEQVIKDLHDIDKCATAFRYACDREGSIIPLPDRMLDLANIREVMEAVGHFFDGADGQLDYNTSVIDW